MDPVLIFIIVFGSIISLAFLSVFFYFGCGYYCSYKSIKDVEDPVHISELKEVPLE